VHEGKGLGLQFLRHVERTRVLVYLVDAASEDPAATLALLKREIAGYSEALAEKPNRVVLSKADLIPPEEHAGVAEQRGLPGARLISAHTGEGLGELLNELWTLILAEEAATRAEAADGG
jgi:GTP-binding protein